MTDFVNNCAIGRRRRDFRSLMGVRDRQLHAMHPAAPEVGPDDRLHADDRALAFGVDRKPMITATLRMEPGSPAREIGSVESENGHPL